MEEKKVCFTKIWMQIPIEDYQRIYFERFLTTILCLLQFQALHTSHHTRLCVHTIYLLSLFVCVLLAFTQAIYHSNVHA